MPKDTFETYDLDDVSVMIVKTSTPYGAPKDSVVTIYRQMEDKSWQEFIGANNNDPSMWVDIPNDRLVPYDIKHARLGHISAIRKRATPAKKIRKLEEYTIR